VSDITKKVKFVFDNEDKDTSTVIYEDGSRQILSRRQADAIAMQMLKADKSASNLREGLKPGPRRNDFIR
jgi:hypothetical protein